MQCKTRNQNNQSISTATPMKDNSEKFSSKDAGDRVLGRRITGAEPSLSRPALQHHLGQEPIHRQPRESVTDDAILRYERRIQERPPGKAANRQGQNKKAPTSAEEGDWTHVPRYEHGDVRVRNGKEEYVLYVDSDGSPVWVDDDPDYSDDDDKQSKKVARMFITPDPPPVEKVKKIVPIAKPGIMLPNGKFRPFDLLPTPDVFRESAIPATLPNPDLFLATAYYYAGEDSVTVPTLHVFDPFPGRTVSAVRYSITLYTGGPHPEADWTVYVNGSYNVGFNIPASVVESRIQRSTITGAISLLSGSYYFDFFWEPSPPSGLTVDVNIFVSLEPTVPVVTNVNVVNTEPIWVTKTQQPLPPSTLANIPLHAAPSTFDVRARVPASSMVTYTGRTGPDHIPSWRCFTVMDNKVVFVEHTTKKGAQYKLKLTVEGAIKRPVETVHEASSYDEMLAKVHNKAMHTINGNTTAKKAQRTMKSMPEQAGQIRLQTKTTTDDTVVAAQRLAEALGKQMSKVTLIEEVHSDVPEIVLYPEEHFTKDPFTVDDMLTFFNGFIGNNTFLHKTELGFISVIMECEDFVVDWALQYLRDLSDELLNEEDFITSEPVPIIPSKTAATTTFERESTKLFSVTRGPAPTLSSEKDKKQPQIEVRQPKSNAQVDHVKNYTHSIARIVHKIKKPDYSGVWFLKSNASRDFKRKIACELWGPQWTKDNEMTSEKWIAYCVCFGISRNTMLLELLHVIPEFVKLDNVTQVSSAVAIYLGSTWVDTQRVRAQEQAIHNKTVHALNGNTSLSITMDDVNKAKGAVEMIQSATADKQLKGSTLWTRLTSMPTSVMPSVTSLYQNAMVRGATISSANVITNDIGLPIPTVATVPRQVRSTVTGLVQNSAVHLLLRSVRPVQWRTSEMKKSEMGTSLEQLASSSNLMTIKNEAISAGGFNGFDMVQLSKRKPFYGLSMDQMMLKYTLFNNVLNYELPSEFHNWADYGTLDQFCIPDPLVPVTYGSNDSPVFGEACGGLTSLFPYLNTAGTISFHLTEKTVPVGQKSAVVYFPPGMFGADDDREALAMFIRGWAPYPADMRTMTIGTFDENGLQAATQLFTIIAGSINVPGMTNIHVILPRNGNVRDPQNNADTLAMTQIIPHTGSGVSTGFAAARTPLLINYVGIVAPVVYNLCEFLYTWTMDHDTTSMANFLARMSRITGIKDSLARMREVGDLVSVGLPYMVEANAGGQVRVAPAQTASGEYVDFFSRRLTRTVVNWPQPVVPEGDVLIAQTDLIAWNLVATGLYYPPDVDPPEMELPEEFNRLEAIMWMHLRALSFAAVWNVHLHTLGWSVACWNSAFTNTTLECYRSHIRGYFAPSTAPYSIKQNAAWGPMLVKLFEACTGFTVAKMKVGGIETSIFDSRTSGINNYNTVIDPVVNAFNNGYIPVTVSDIWKNVILPHVPKEQMAFPPPSGNTSTQGFCSGLEHFRINDNQVGSFVDEAFHKPSDKSDHFILLSAETKWNERLMYVFTPARGTIYDGSIPGNAPLANTFPSSRRIVTPPWFGAAQPPTNEYSWNTCSMPDVTSTGQYIHAITTAANASVINRAQVGRASLNAPVWQLAGVYAHNDLIDTPSITIRSPFDAFRAKPDLKATGVALPADSSPNSEPIVKKE